MVKSKYWFVGPSGHTEKKTVNTMSPTFRTPRFTLIELLVVVAIVAILASLLLPALKTARDTAKTAKCVSNEKQVGIMCFQYDGDFDGYLPPGLLNGQACTAVCGNAWDTRIWQVWLSRLYTDIQLYCYCHDAKIRSSVFHCPMHVCKGPGSTWEGANYGYNTSVGGIRTVALTKPAITRLEGDFNDYFLDNNGAAPPAWRHAGGMLNLLYCDGHVATIKPVEYSKTRKSP